MDFNKFNVSLQPKYMPSAGFFGNLTQIYTFFAGFLLDPGGASLPDPTHAPTAMLILHWRR